MHEYRLPPETKISHAVLRVRKIEHAHAFYTQLLGYKLIARDANTLLLSPTGENPYHIKIIADENAPRQTRRNAGLFHVAIRFPTRKALAQVVLRLLSQQWPFQGASDHGVSEAFYLPDPDGNGIELYCDRPEDVWPRENGRIAMVTDPLDINDLLSEGDKDKIESAGMEPGVDIGHVHIQVTSLDNARRFYQELLGLEVTQENYGGALFLSAGGYHHHLGTNTWNSDGGKPSQPGEVGLVSYGYQFPDEFSWLAVTERVKTSCGKLGDAVEEDGYKRIHATDLDGIGVELVV